MGRTAGLIRADGEIVNTVENSDLIVIQRQDSNASGQYTPRLISTQNLLAGASTSFTPTSVPFADGTGSLTEDTTNLNYDDATDTLFAANLDTDILSVNNAGVTNVLSVGGVAGSGGTINVYATGANNGNVSVTTSANAGNTVTNINVASQAAARTYTIPDAGASTSFVMEAGTQTISGAKTFSSDVTTNGDLICNTAGGTIQIQTGTNAAMGSATLVSGTVFVNNTSYTANSVVFITLKTILSLSNPAAYGVDTLVPGTGFRIISSEPTDDSEVWYWIVNRGV